MNKRLEKLQLAAGCGVAAMLAAAMLAGPAAAQSRSYNIPAEPLSQALRDYARASGRQIMFTEDLVRGRVAPPLKGPHDDDEALRRLLQGAGLSYELRPTGAIMIVRGVAPVAAQDAPVISEVVVTGTNIRSEGASAGSNVRSIGREEIERSGYVTLQQVIAASPENHSSGASDNVVSPDNVAAGNFSAAIGVNLRGLGNSASLVLLDGRPLAPAGFGADFADISSIPLSAIDHIEILGDGASAIYGADAVAGVVNIILRKNLEGAETRVRYGRVTDGPMSEWQVSQAFGKDWNGGSAFVNYDHTERTALPASARRQTADTDLRPLGGGNYSSTWSNPGNFWDLISDPFHPRPAYGIPAGQDGTNLQPGDLRFGQLNYHNGHEGTDVLPDQTLDSVFASATQRAGDSVELSLDGRFSRRRYESRNGGFGTTLFVTAANPFFVSPDGLPFALLDYNFIDDLGPLVSRGTLKTYNVAASARIELPHDWRLRTYAAYAREDTDTSNADVDMAAVQVALDDPDPATAFNPFGDGSHTNPATLETFRQTDSTDSALSLWSVNAVADGTLFAIPGGDLKAAVGVDYRQESFGLTSSFDGSVTHSGSVSQASRRVAAVFGELQAPIVSEANALPGVRSLTLSAAVRLDDYLGDKSQSGTAAQIDRDGVRTVNPKFGVNWSPTQGLNLRASYGTSFRAPNLSTVGARSIIQIFSLADQGGSNTQALALLGTAPDLQNETSRTWTAGLDWRPTALPGFAAHLTYFDIDFRNRISSVATPNILLDPRYAALVERNPSADELAALCVPPAYLGNPAQCTPAQIGAIADFRTNNIGRTKVNGLDAQLNYSWPTPNGGRFDVGAAASYMFHFKEQIGDASPFVELINTLGNPVDLKLRSSLGWDNGKGFNATLFVNYVDGYDNNLSSLKPHIGAWVTADLTLGYRFIRPSNAALDGLEFSLSVQNLFDADPPFADNPSAVGYDPANADILGRFVSLSVTKRW